MTVGQIFTKIGIFIENRQMFMLLNYNCAKLANIENFKACIGGAVFSWTQCRNTVNLLTAVVLGGAYTTKTERLPIG